MLIHSARRPWLSALIHAVKRPARRQHARRQPGSRGSWTAAGCRFGSQGELLEDRTLLSTITVTSLADNVTNDGQITLREAIQAANGDSVADATEGSQAGSGIDTIVFDASLTAGGPATITLNGTELAITTEITITGPGARLLTIDAQNNSRIFNIDDGDAESAVAVNISGLTLTNGMATDGDDSSVSADDDGGAIFSRENLVLTFSAISGNSAAGTGGGIAVSEPNGAKRARIDLRNSTVSGNTATDFGGGIWNNFGLAFVVDSTISGNVANTSGGGFYNNGTADFINSTIAGNSANGMSPGSGGGGVFNLSSGVVTLQNTIVASNSAEFDEPDIYGLVTAEHSLIEEGFSGNVIDGGEGGNIIGEDSLLGPLADNGGPTQTHALLPGSPAIDAGFDDFIVQLNDQRGAPFVRSFDDLGGPNSGVDIGAFELQPLIVDTLIDENDGDYSTGDLSLREAIDLAQNSSSVNRIEFDSALTSGGPATISLGGTELSVTGSVNIFGPGADLLTIDAQGNSRVFRINDEVAETHQAVSISDLTLANGASMSGDGGAIATFETLALVNVTIKNSQTTGNGGGIYTAHDLNVRQSTIRGNSADVDGGGIYTSAAAAGITRITDSTIANNSADGDGGGIWNGEVTQIATSTLAGNRATGFGGAILNGLNDTLTVVNSTLSGNSATAGVGGIINTGNVSLIGSTITGNTAENLTGGLFNNNDGITSLTSTIVAGNLGPAQNDLNPFGIYTGTHNLIGDPASAASFVHGTDSNIVGQSDGTGGRELLDIAVTLGPLKDNGGPTFTHALLAGSAAIDAGAAGILITPTAVTSSTNGTDEFPAANLINGSGLTPTLNAANQFSVTHGEASNSTAWATASSGSDYFDSGTNPVLTFTLDGLHSISDIVVWGYHFGSANNNEAAALDVEFSTDGGATFDRSVSVMHARTVQNSETISLGDVFDANVVRLTITDNHFGSSGGNGGDRVGLGEVRFLLSADSVDQRGTARPQGAGFDIGAFEFQNLEYDYGDAPDTGTGIGAGNYQTLFTDNGPRHIVDPNVRLGATVDADNGTLQNSTATADDNFGALLDDEDGVLNPLDLRGTIGAAPRVTLLATNMTSRSAVLFGWIDYNQDGFFDNATEHVQKFVAAGTDNGRFTLTFPTIPAGSTGTTYARFRLSTYSANAESPTGAAADGEVEDYVFSITAPSTGSVKQTVEINLSTPNGPTLSHSDYFGSSVTSLGDLDGDGVNDLAVGASGDDDDSPSSLANSGAVHVLLLNADGTVKQTVEINSSTLNGPTLSNGDVFGSSLTSLGDLDGDGVNDLAVGASGDDTGGNLRGAVHVLLLNADGSVKQTFEINSSTPNGPMLSNFDGFGSSLTSLGDLDGDGVNDLAVGARYDGNGVVHVLFLNVDGSVKQTVEINASTTNGPTLDVSDRFGSSLTSLGDLDGDGVNDLAVGASRDDEDGDRRGVVHVLLLNADGSVKQTVEINSSTTNEPTLSDVDLFGSSLTSLGDLDGDGINDLAVGVLGDDTGGSNRGAVHVLLLNTDGSVKRTIEINSGTVNGPTLDNFDYFGSSVTSLGDLNGDALPDLAIGAIHDDDGAFPKGTVHVLFLDIPDVTPPVLESFTRLESTNSVTSADSLTFRVTFNEPVTNIDVTDFLVDGPTTATVANVISADINFGLLWDVTVSGNELATFRDKVGLNLADDQNITDLHDNALPDSEPATDESYTVFPVDEPIVVDTTTDTDDGNLAVGEVSLREALRLANLASGPNTIVFDATVFSTSQTISLTQGELEITDAVTITGPGQELLTIDAGDQSRVFHIFALSGAVTLSGLDMARGKAPTYQQGGAIFSAARDVLTISDSTIRDSVADTYGGGIAVESGSVTVAASTISGNSTTGAYAYGGGIYTDSGSLTVTASTISENSTTGAYAYGGGIFTDSGSLTVTASTISENSTTGSDAFGGGIAVSSGSLTVTASTISGNSTHGQRAFGGGIAVSTGSVTVTDSTISGNRTTGPNAGGAGIGLNSAGATLFGSTISGNSTTGNNADGGGLFAGAGLVTVTASTFSGNSTTGGDSNGGGIGVFAAVVNLISSTITNNSTTGVGGGLSVQAFDAERKLTFHSTIIAGNTDNGMAPDFESPTSPETNLDVSYSLIGDNTGTSLDSAPIGIPDGNGNLIGTSGVPIDPLLGPLKDNGGPTRTHALVFGSPAIDAGPTTLITPVSVTSSGPDAFPADNLINGSGLSAAPTLENLSTVTHDAGSSGAWATERPGDPGSDYFASGGENPVLTFQLGALLPITNIVLWGYHFGTPNNSEAAVLKVEFSTDGGITFDHSQRLTRTRTGESSGTITPFGTYVANAIRLTITDNHFGLAGAGGGERVGLGEVRFLSRSEEFAPFPGTDQRGTGFARQFDADGDGLAQSDIGAFEVQTPFIDYGDAPDTGVETGSGNYETLLANGGPSHTIVTGLRLGATIDSNDGTLQDSSASADDVAGSHRDDEDGVLDPLDLLGTVGASPTVTLLVTNTTDHEATLMGWIDYNQDGVFDNGTESAQASVRSTLGERVTLTFPPVPEGATGTTYARFRLTTDQNLIDNPSPIGPASDGEVEDYAFSITAQSSSTVDHFLKIADDTSGLPAGIFANNDFFGSSVTNLGDVDGDGVNDIAVGAMWDKTGGSYRGAVYVLLLNTDGTVKSSKKIASDINGGPTLSNGDRFGNSVAAMGDLDGDGVPDLAVGAYIGATGGAVHVLLLNADGTVKNSTKIASGMSGGPTVTIGDLFGNSLASVGDLDGDGVTDLVVGARGHDPSGVVIGKGRGAVHVLLLNADGTVKSSTMIASGTNGGPTLGNYDEFGFSVASVGDLDGDGVGDLAVGADYDDTTGPGAANGAVHVLLLNADGTVKSSTKIPSDINGGPALSESGYFGSSVAGVGDLDGDGVGDLAVGSRYYGTDRTGRTERGALHVLLLNADGTVKSSTMIASDIGGGPTLTNGDNFGRSVASVGDLDGDGLTDLVVGAPSDNTGGQNRGAVYVLSLSSVFDFGDAPDATVGTGAGNFNTTQADNGPRHRIVDSQHTLFLGASVDGDSGTRQNASATADDSFGAQRDDEDGIYRALDQQGTIGTLPTIGLRVTNTTGREATLMGWIDYNQDGVFDNSEFVQTSVSTGLTDVRIGLTFPEIPLGSAGTTYARFRLTTDLNLINNPSPIGPASDGEVEDYVYEIVAPSTGNVDSFQKIAHELNGGPTLVGNDQFGSSVASLGDLNGDGVPDIAVGAFYDDAGGSNRGAVYVLFMKADGTVDNRIKIAHELNGGPTLANGDRFGRAIVSPGDLDGDGIVDLAVGALGHDTFKGAVHVLLMNSDGTARETVLINDGDVGLMLDDGDRFGISLASPGDLDGDGVADLVAGAVFDDTNGTNRGAAYVLFMNADGTARSSVKLASGENGVPTLANNDFFGSAVVSPGDVNKDGTSDLIVGANGDDGNGSNRGAVHVLLMNADGTVQGSTRIANSVNGGPFLVNDTDRFGSSLAAVGDLDGDGIVDVVVGASLDDSEATDSGAVFVLLMNQDGTAKDAFSKVANGFGNGPSLAEGDNFGSSLTSAGDINGDGVVDLIVGAIGDDTGAADSNRGAAYVIFMEARDITPPELVSITRQTPADSVTEADSLTFRVTFNEAVSAFSLDSTDFVVNGSTTATVTAVTSADATAGLLWDVTVSGGDLATFRGLVGLDLATGQNISDQGGNRLPGGEPATDEVYTVFDGLSGLASFEVDVTTDVYDGNFGPGQLSLREAVLLSEIVAGADTITFDATVFATQQTIALSNGEFAITDGLTITGPGSGLLTIDAQQQSRIFRITDGDNANQQSVVISGLTLSGGLADDELSTPSEDDLGGAIFSREALTLSRVTISGNGAIFGGAIHNAPGSSLTISDSSISANTAVQNGGGINNDGFIRITGSTFSSNSASANGGGIYNNTAGVLEVSNSTFSSNSAVGGGGGIRNDGTATVSHTTITGNTATFSGGGIRNFGTLTLESILAAGNLLNGTSSDVHGAVTAASFDNLIGVDQNLTGITHSINGNLIGTTDAPIDPKLGPLAANGGPTFTHALLADSPAIDAASVSRLVTPVSVTSSTADTDFLDATNLINGGGLNGELTIRNFQSITHSSANASTAWVTSQPGPDGSDYFELGGNPPVLTFSLGEEVQLLTDIVLWGYHFDFPLNNEAKAFDIAFSTDGGETFGVPQSLTHVRTAAESETISLGGVFPANTVQVTFTDNHFGTPDAEGGDRVGLGEVRFVSLVNDVDQRGISRHRGSAPDIGAFEFEHPDATLTITPDGTVSNAETLTFTFQFNNPAFDFDASDVSITNGSAGAFTAVDQDTYTLVVTPTAEGAVTVSVSENVTRDGNSAASATVTSDQTSPTVSVALDDSILKAGEAATITFTFTEAPIGFAAEDVTVQNGTLSSFAATGDPLVFTATFTPTADIEAATNIISIGTGYADTAGNTGTAGDSANYTIDTLAPTGTVTFEDSSLNSTNDSSLVTIQFSEDVTGFDLSDLTATNGILSDFTAVDSVTFTVVFTADQDVDSSGNVVAGTTYTDIAGNTPQSISGLIPIDTLRPTVVIEVVDASLNLDDDSSLVTIEFSEEVTGFDLSDISPGNGTLSGFTMIDGDSFTVIFTADANFEGSGNVRISEEYADLAGNPGFSFSGTVPVDTQAPAVSIAPDGTVTSDSLIVFTFQFSEAVSGFLAEDISIANGSAETFIPVDVDTFTLEVTPASPGTVTVSVLSGAALDAAGNLSVSASASVTSSAPGIVVLPAAGTFEILLSGGDLVVRNNGGAEQFRRSAVTVSVLEITGSSGADIVTVLNTGGAVMTPIVFSGGQGADQFDASLATGSTTLLGGSGNDTLLGGTNDDFIIGGTGNDMIAGGNGDDRIGGRSGNDTLTGGDGNDTLQGGGGRDMIEGGGDSDQLSGAGGRDTITGGDGDDLLRGGAGSDLLDGDGGEDTLAGGAGLDNLAGGVGNDTLNGVFRDDTFNQVVGRDTLFGGQRPAPRPAPVNAPPITPVVVSAELTAEPASPQLSSPPLDTASSEDIDDAFGAALLPELLGL